MTCVVTALPIRNLSEVEKVKRIDSDYVELRLDYLSELPSVEEFIEKVKEFKDRIIVTIRDVSEGGVNYVEEERKVRFYKALFDEGFIYDVEARFLKKHEVPVEGKIVSLHYFESLPTFEEVKELFYPYANRALLKLAVVGIGKYRQLLIRVLEEFPNVAVMPMKVNPVERIAYSILGSRLLYAHSGEETAQGQMYYKDAMRILSELGISCKKLTQ